MKLLVTAWVILYFLTGKAVTTRALCYLILIRAALWKRIYIPEKNGYFFKVDP